MSATTRARRSDALYADGSNAYSRRTLCDMIAERESRLEDAEAENDRLRELVKYMHRCYVRGHDWGPYGAPEKEHVEECMRELGIEMGR